MFSEIFKILIKNINAGVFLLLSTTPFLASASQAEKAAAIIKRLESRFSGMSSTDKVGTMGLDSMNLFFENVQKKIPAIETLMRTNSNGMVINEISSHQMDYKMRNVSDQKWFLHVKTTRSPYYGLNRDSSGSASFFWAWPIISDDSLFNGAISTKIKPSEILKMASISDNTPIAIVFNNTSVIKRNPSGIPLTKNDTISLSKQSKLIIQSSSVQNIQNDINSTAQSIPGTSGENNSVSDTTVEQSHETTHKVQKVSPQGPAQSAPTVYKSDFSEPPPTKKHSVVITFLLTILTMVFLAAVSFLIMKYKKSTGTNSSSLPEIDNDKLHTDEIDPALLATDNTPTISHTASHNLAEQHSDESPINQESIPGSDLLNPSAYDEETKAHYLNDYHENVIESVCKEPDQQIEATDPLEQRLRKELYREIHSQIMQWVVGESARLSGRIEELNERLEKSENENTPELEQIRQEAQVISKEIELFKTHLTKNEQ